jgi:uncharacterized membrane protein
MLDQNLLNSVKSLLLQGSSQEQIFQNLLGQGKTVKEISDCFEAVKAEAGKGETQSRTISAVVIIGAILVGAGIFSFIASNWQYFEKPLKLGIIIISMLLSYAGGWYLKEVKDSKRTGMALILLGVIIYGSGIFLVAQMYNIRANWPDGFILWMFGVVLISFALDLSGFLYFGWVLGLIALIGNPFTILGSLFGYNPLLLTSTAILILTTIVCFFVARNFRKKIDLTKQDIY